MDFDSPAAFTCNQYLPSSCVPARSPPPVELDDEFDAVVFAPGLFIIACITKYPPTPAISSTTTKPTPATSSAPPFLAGATAGVVAGARPATGLGGAEAGSLGCEMTVGIVAVSAGSSSVTTADSDGLIPVTRVAAVCCGEVTVPRETAPGAEARCATDDDGTIPLVASASTSSFSRSPAVDCRSLRSFAIARATAILKLSGTPATSCKEAGVTLMCWRRSSGKVSPSKGRLPAINS